MATPSLLYQTVKLDLTELLGKSLATSPRMIHWINNAEPRVTKATGGSVKNASLYNATYSALVHELADQFGLTMDRAEKVTDLLM